MTEVTSATQSSPSLVNSRTGLADNFEMFLTLLTEQMKNQDPLNPLDSTQFINQLVDFSSVEQQIAQNQNLESLLILQSAAAQANSVGYIGRVAMADTPMAYMENGSANWEYILPDDAESVTLVIKQGERVVARSTGEVTAGSHEFEWDGKSETGTDLEEGVYTLDVIATNADGESIPAEIRASGRVTGIDMSGSEVIVQMGNISVPLSSILAVRQAGSGDVEDNPYLEPTV